MNDVMKAAASESTKREPTFVEYLVRGIPRGIGFLCADLPFAVAAPYAVAIRPIGFVVGIENPISGPELESPRSQRIMGAVFGAMLPATIMMGVAADKLADRLYGKLTHG